MIRSRVTFFLLFLALQAWGAEAPLTIEPNPGPGVDTCKSDQYRLEIWDGSKWVESYTYMADNPQGSDVWPGGAIHFASFGANGEVPVRVTRLPSPITSVSTSPKSKHIQAAIDQGKAIVHLKPYDKVWLLINDNAKATTLLIFADPLKPAVPAGARHYRRGVHFVGDNDAIEYSPRSDQTLYLDAGAWVKGRLDMRDCHGAKIMGPGVLSGEVWKVTDPHPPSMIQGARNAMVREAGLILAAVNSYEGITLVRAPGYNFCSVQADVVRNLKLISPWRHSTDGFQIIPDSEQTSVIEECFAFVGDDVFFPRENFKGNLEIRNCFVASSNNSFFQICYWGQTLSHNYHMHAHDLDLKSYLGSNSAVFRASINNQPTTGEKNMTFENIRIEGDLKGPLLQIENREYFWPNQTNRPETKMGNTYNYVFRNVSLLGKQGKPSTLLGLDADNGHHDYLFENVSIDGTVLNSRNFSEFCKVNKFTWNISVGAAGEPPVAVSSNAE